MNEYQVNSYSNLENGENNLINTSSSLKSSMESGNINMQSVYNDNSFCGPIADHISEAWDIINRATDNNINNLNNNVKTIENIKQGYQDTDQQVSSHVGGI